MKKELYLRYKKVIPYIISCVVLAIILIIVYSFLNSAKEEIVTYKTKDGQKIYFYIEQAKYEYSSKITISSENEIIKLTTDGYEHDFDSEPIYYKDKKKLILSNDMSLIFTKENYIQKKVNKFTVINYDGSYRLISKNLDYPINDGFLFDGNDMYIFLNETTIKIGDHEIVLSPFSYARYNYNHELLLYNYDDDKIMYFESIDENVLASGDNYIVNLGIDAIIYKDGQKLLMKNFDFLKKLEQEK